MNAAELRRAAIIELEKSSGDFMLFVSTEQGITNIGHMSDPMVEKMLLVLEFEPRFQKVAAKREWGK